jgi:hypothetical protein
MGRAANALDWTDEGGGVGLRALIAYPTEPPPPAPPWDPNAELRLREEERERVSGFASEERTPEEEPLTQRFSRDSGVDVPEEGAEPLSARGIARLAALADWMAGEEPSGAVVALVRSFLRDVQEVGLAVGALVSAGRASAGPELDAAIHSLAVAVGMWRSNLVEHVDDLALSDHRSFSGWASLPEYSSAFTLAIVRPALAEADLWADAAAVRGGVDLGPLVRNVTSGVERLNATLRAAILGPDDREERGELEDETMSRPESPLSAAAW